MSSNKPLSWNATLVLQALAQGHGYGFEIMNATMLPSGTVYPVLRRLEASALVASSWEDETRAHAEGRPARRNYEATEPGLAALSEARKRLAAQQALFGDLAVEDAGGR
jgi:PadR family transcriptional regulator